MDARHKILDDDLHKLKKTILSQSLLWVPPEVLFESLVVRWDFENQTFLSFTLTEDDQGNHMYVIEFNEVREEEGETVVKEWDTISCYNIQILELFWPRFAQSTLYSQGTP